MKIVFCAFVIIKDLYIFSFFHNQLLRKRKDTKISSIDRKRFDFECLTNETGEVKYQSL